MLPFRRILFPVDYSEPCQAVVPYVKEMIRHFSADLTLVHAYGPAAFTRRELVLTDPELLEKGESSKNGACKSSLWKPSQASMSSASQNWVRSDLYNLA